MKASDILRDALRFRGVHQNELAEKTGQQPKTLSKKISTNRLSAQELVDYVRKLGYTISLVDIHGQGEIAVRRRGIGPRVKKMVDGIVYDTQRSDALCHTNVENGWYMELYRDDEGRFFVVHYSLWADVDPLVTRCPDEEAKSLYEAYSDETDPPAEKYFDQ